MAKKNTMTREETRDMFLRARLRMEALPLDGSRVQAEAWNACITSMTILAEEACSGNGCDPPKDPPGPPNGD